MAADIVAAGDADLVGMVRAHIADPDRLLDEDPPCGGALLTGRHERARERGRDGAIDVGVRHGDERVVPAHLELRGLAVRGPTRGRRGRRPPTR